jgi:pSer/pThr/pTyr-binding forkhead associated (FHA) protein
VSVRLQLRHLSGALAGRLQELTLEEGEAAVIGRDASCAVKLHDGVDDAASGLHARLLLRQGRFAIEDQRSTNGTFVDGARCTPFEPVVVADGARIQLGLDGPELQLSLPPSAGAARVPVPALSPAPAVGEEDKRASGVSRWWLLALVVAALAAATLDTCRGRTEPGVPAHAQRPGGPA